jgi:hypothetical protein
MPPKINERKSGTEPGSKNKALFWNLGRAKQVPKQSFVLRATEASF